MVYKGQVTSRQAIHISVYHVLYVAEGYCSYVGFSFTRCLLKYVYMRYSSSGVYTTVDICTLPGKVHCVLPEAFILIHTYARICPNMELLGFFLQYIHIVVLCACSERLFCRRHLDSLVIRLMCRYNLCVHSHGTCLKYLFL